MSGYLHNMGLAFRAVTLRHADRVALRLLSRDTLTYSQLDSLSNRLAGFIVSKNVRSGDVVAIFNAKTEISYSVMLACLKLGVTYVNLDPASPAERLGKMLAVSKPRLIFVSGDAGAVLKGMPDFAGKAVDYGQDVFAGNLNSFDDVFPAENAAVDGGTPAYIMFTSGSTGFPKGAVMSHANLLNFIGWSHATFAPTPEDRVANLNPLHFDNSVFDFYTALFSGASLVAGTDDLPKQPRRLLDVLNSLGVTVWFSVPSLIVYALKMRALRSSDLPDLRVMIFGGEGFPKNQLRALHKQLAHRVKLVNVYGPTECTCICSSYDVDASDMASDDLLPLGPIASNFRQIVVDQDNKPVPAGEIGELLLGGPNVGIGYYGNSERTAAAFVQNPVLSNHRDIVYRTGDLVRYDDARNLLFFCGRKDNQVKRMGYRIELEEIEVAIGSLPYVIESAVVFVVSDGEAGRIVAHVAARNADEISLVNDLRSKLPPYMIPDAVVFADALPKNPNGKIDRRVLAEAGVGS